jgi:hypothetical protein
VKRWAFPIRICVILLLGAIVNVAVAWGCAAWYPSALYASFDSWYPTRGSIDTWNSMALPTWPDAAFVTELELGFGGEPPGWILLAYDQDPFPGTDFPIRPSLSMSVTWEDYGWPMSALRAIEWSESSGLGKLKVVKTAYVAVERPSDNRPVRWLPIRPIWPGFAINTLFYAGILWGGWLLFAAPLAVRRRRRIKRGLCPACAYPVGDSPVCTECGKQLPSPSR